MALITFAIKLKTQYTSQWSTIYSDHHSPYFLNNETTLSLKRQAQENEKEKEKKSTKNEAKEKGEKREEMAREANPRSASEHVCRSHDGLICTQQIPWIHEALSRREISRREISHI